MNPGPDGEGSQVVRVGDRSARSQCTRKTARRRRGCSEGVAATAVALVLSRSYSNA